MTFFYFRQTAPSLVSIAVSFMLIMGLALLFAYALSSIFKTAVI